MDTNFLSASFDKLVGAFELLHSTKSVLDELLVLHDTVTAEDVVAGAGKMVAAGIEPTAMAGILSEMPEKGEELHQWIAGHGEEIGKRLEQLGQVQRQVGHQLGTSAMQELMGRLAPPPPTPVAPPMPVAPQAGNPLAIGGPNA